MSPSRQVERRDGGTAAPIVERQFADTYVTRYNVTRYEIEGMMALASERMKAMRERRRRQGLREIRLVVPDARSPTVRRRVAKEVAALNQANENDALDWIEAVYKLDNDETR